MTTDAQPPQDGEWIPRYFSDFRREFDAFKDENARQHVELAGRISGLEVHVAERISGLETHVAERISSLEVSVAERISSLEVSVAERISSLEVNVAERISGLETHFAQVETRIAQMEARLMWRGLGGLALVASLAVAAMRLLPA